jgi:hypothetical protein
MSAEYSPLNIIQGRVVHKTSNALQITFQGGPGEAFAVGVQGAGDGKGKKLGVLFGFKNGGTGNHVLTFTDGRTLNIASKDSQPSVFTAADGSEVATIHRGASSRAVLSGGTEILQFVSAPTDAKTPDLFSMIVLDPAGAEVGRLDVVRRSSGWTIGRAIDAAWDTYIWWDRAGQPMKVPLLGTRLLLVRPVSDLELDILLGACVDMAIGLRPYIAEMA